MRTGQAPTPVPRASPRRCPPSCCCSHSRWCPVRGCPSSRSRRERPCGVLRCCRFAKRLAEGKSRCEDAQQGDGVCPGRVRTDAHRGCASLMVRVRLGELEPPLWLHPLQGCHSQPQRAVCSRLGKFRSLVRVRHHSGLISDVALCDCKQIGSPLIPSGQKTEVHAFWDLHERPRTRWNLDSKRARPPRGSTPPARQVRPLANR